MINELLESNKISPSEFKLYQMFTSPLGHEVLTGLMEELFWEEPSDYDFKGTTFAFYDGRRSVIRGIKATIKKVEHIIHEQNLEVKDE